MDYTGLGIGDPLDRETDIGPMVSAAQRHKVRDQLDAAVAAGAEVVTGGDTAAASAATSLPPQS